MVTRGLLDRLGESRHFFLWVVLAGLLVSLPSLAVGLVADDFVHRALADDLVPVIHRGPTELYEFIAEDPQQIAAIRDLGGFPWWTTDELSVRFFRPLPSALMVAEYRLLGDAVWAARLHSLAWFAALLLVVTGLLRQLLTRRAATAASLIYALSVIHVSTVAWIAARHALMTAVFGLAGLWLHVRARQAGQEAGSLVAAPLLLAMAYLCSESALGAAGLILSYELLAA